MEDVNEASKHFFSLSGEGSHRLITNHAGTLLYKTALAKDEKATQPDRRFHHNNSIWEEINFMGFRRTDLNVTLDSFFIFEWFPRSPGLFYTPNGMKARREAQKSVISTENGVVTYDPYGKKSMLDGGIGNIRLQPIQLQGEEYHFVTASSDGQADEGFPVAIPAVLFGPLLDEITSRGTVVRDLTGKLSFIPERLSSLYNDFTGVPKVFLKVNDIAQPSNAKSRSLQRLCVRVAVSFLSAYEGFERIYGTYTTFNPSDRNDMNDSIRWIEEEYVQKQYKGKIITDFDEITSHFKGAPFSLEKVMSGSLKMDQLKYLGDEHLFREILSNQKNIIIETQSVHMETNNFNISGGNQGAVGKDVHVSNVVFNQLNYDHIDLQALQNDLEKLRAFLPKERDNSLPSQDINAIEKAEAAAKAGDKSSAISALLKAGKITWGIAEKVGATLIAAILKQHIGI